MSFFRNLFPHSNIPNIKIYYILSFFSEFYFIVGNWIFFWLKFMKYGELGFLDMLAFLFGFIMEVPAGAIADSIGRKKTIAIAFFFTSIGFLTIATSQENIQLVSGFFIAQIGWAFYSGSAEALAYDTLKEEKQEKHFDKVSSTAQMLGLTALVIGSIVGGLVYEYYFRLPHLLTGSAFVFGFIASLFLHEPRIDSEKFSFKMYFNHIKEGFSQLMLPSIRPLLPLLIPNIGIAFMYGAGIIQPAIGQSFGYDGMYLSFLGAVGLTAAAVVVRFIPWMRTHLTDRQGLQVLACVYIVGFFLFTQPLGWLFGGLIMICMSVTRPLVSSWTSVVVNRELPSKYRATTLSAMEMLRKIPYIMVAALAGALMDGGMLKQLCLGISVVIGVVVLFNALTQREQKKALS